MHVALILLVLLLVHATRVLSAMEARASTSMNASKAPITVEAMRLAKIYRGRFLALAIWDTLGPA